jgi:hypothetical protein
MQAEMRAPSRADNSWIWMDGGMFLLSIILGKQIFLIQPVNARPGWWKTLYVHQHLINAS